MDRDFANHKTTMVIYTEKKYRKSLQCLIIIKVISVMLCNVAVKFKALTDSEAYLNIFCTIRGRPA